MWQGERGSEEAFEGKHVHAKRLLNSPQAVSKPHPPIMIGGGGEQRTLRLVAKYADATNVFGGPDQVAHKYEVLRRHCEAIGRPYDEIERSNLQSIEIAPDGARVSRSSHGWSSPETAGQIVERFGWLADAGVQHIITGGLKKYDLDQIEQVGRDIIPQIRSL
jgi:alkanesulfonate monooxygenase SsuD/methylene tetrahydromethanopterin reductase-like flavin-dependent oxidoreductase (luciferase family)